MEVRPRIRTDRDAAQCMATARDTATVFDVRRLTKTYHVGDVDVFALRDVSLQLPEREFVVLLGPSQRVAIARAILKRPAARISARVR